MENSWRRTGAALGGAQEPRAPEATRGSGCAATRRRELFDENGALIPELAELPPKGTKDERQPAREWRRACCADLVLPDFPQLWRPVEKPGTTMSEATKVRARSWPTSSRRTQRISESSD